MEEISQDERKKIREEERRKIMKEMKREKDASYSSHDSCKTLSEELNNYYGGRNRSHTKHHSQRREKNIQYLNTTFFKIKLEMEEITKNIK